MTSQEEWRVTQTHASLFTPSERNHAFHVAGMNIRKHVTNDVLI